MCKRLGPGKQALRLQIGKYAFASFPSIQTAVRTTCRSDLRIFTNDADLRQIMPLAHFKIGRIVCRSNFHNTCSERRIDHIVLNEWNFPIHQRQDHSLAFVFCVSFVVRIHGNRRVAQHRFGSCCRNLNECVVAPF